MPSGLFFFFCIVPYLSSSEYFKKVCMSVTFALLLPNTQQELLKGARVIWAHDFRSLLITVRKVLHCDSVCGRGMKLNYSYGNTLGSKE